MTNRTDLIYGSPEYLAEVSRIHEQEAYGVKTAATWNRLNDRTAPHPWARLWDLFGSLGVALVWLIGAAPFILLAVSLLKTFYRI